MAPPAPSSMLRRQEASNREEPENEHPSRIDHRRFDRHRARRRRRLRQEGRESGRLGSEAEFINADVRTLMLSRYTKLTAEQKMLVRQLKLDLPPQPPPRITASGKAVRTLANVV